VTCFKGSHTAVCRIILLAKLLQITVFGCSHGYCLSIKPCYIYGSVIRLLEEEDLAYMMRLSALAVELICLLAIAN